MKEEEFKAQNQKEAQLCPRGHAHARARDEGKLKCESCDCAVVCRVDTLRT
jgi:hypothetical protein